MVARNCTIATAESHGVQVLDVDANMLSEVESAILAGMREKRRTGLPGVVPGLRDTKIGWIKRWREHGHGMPQHEALAAFNDAVRDGKMKLVRGHMMRGDYEYRLKLYEIVQPSGTMTQATDRPRTKPRKAK